MEYNAFLWSPLLSKHCLCLFTYLFIWLSVFVIVLFLKDPAVY